ncbi:4.1 protein [Dictyocaulus viviparus]|uniref:4.1 protein n=1 Tax=Dictyocaulus viviparus TaxID=29172 RepID=A0A0D8XFH1_DICVI|nr:4.1 protein [Dictyocaulus viviparus]
MHDTSSKKPKKQKKIGKDNDSSDTSRSSEDEKNQVHVVPAKSGAVTLPHYADPEEKDGRVLRRETNELKYHIKGEGILPEFDPKNPSLASIIAEAERLNQRSPRLEHAERTVTVRALAPLPLSYEESGQPHTTISTWQESNRIPDEVTTEYDEKGNKITRTLKTSQVKQTVQKQTFQNYIIPQGGETNAVTVERVREETTPLGLTTSSTNDPVANLPHVVQTHSRSVIYDANPESQHHEDLGEFVSCKTLTSGNRTVETYTYKTEHDGIIETHVEHRVTIHSDEPIDHDAELSHAIMEATQMNPDMTVEKIEVRQESTA